MIQHLLKLGFIVTIYNVCLLCSGAQIASLRGWRNLNIQRNTRVPASDWVSRKTQNIQQCLRLCWLFKTCQTLSYIPKDNMCHLHDSQGDGATPNRIPDSTSVVVGMSEASLDKSVSELQGCDTRPCTESQMCAPARRKGFYMCLETFSVMCQARPEPPTHATVASDGFYTMTYNCEDGYVPAGSSSVSTCDRSTGKWSAIDLLCTHVDCKDPPVVAGAEASQNDTTGYNAKVTYRCFDGAVSASTSMTIRCQATGNWTSPPEPCRIVSCGNPVSTESTEIVVLPRSSTNPYPGLTDNELARAYGGQANHTCKTGYESIGTRYFISECLADSNWTTTSRFSCQVVDCGPPPTMANASVTTNGTVYQSVASYICDTGYETDQSPLQISCGEDGTWTNVSAVCQPVDCGRPTPLDHAEMDYNSTTLGSVVTDKCIQLVVTVSETNSTRVCEENGNWSVSNLTCVFVPCGSPPDVDHATAIVDFIPGGFVALYTCDTGYEFFSQIVKVSPQKTCLTGAVNWTSDIVECDIVNCREPPPVENATFNVTGLTYMSTVTYTCDTGFKLDTDNNNRTCLDTGTWSVEDVECVGITCPQLPEVENAFFKKSTDGMNYGSVISYECRNNAILVTSTNNVTCQSDGWEPRSVRCQFVVCGEPPFVANSSRQIIYDSEWQVMKAVYTCEPGYNIRSGGVSSLICDNNSKSWSGGEVYCQTCGPPPEVANATVTVTIDTATLNSIAQYDCSPGFVLSGNAFKRTCQLDGTWSPENISCNIRDCGNPPEEMGANLVYTETTYSSVASYKCQPGYNTSSKEPRYIKCTENGVWNATENSHQEYCAPVDCGPPDSVENGTITVTNTSYRGSAVYACDYGFVLSGSGEKTCNESGIWDGDENLECLVDFCISPPVIANAVVNSTLNISNGVQAEYECLYGFQMIGDSSSLTCLRKQNWTQESFWCRKINCGMPPSLPYSTVSFQSTTIDSVATYTCVADLYPLDNVTQKTCTSDEKWSDDHVECVAETDTVCPVPPADVPNAVANYTSRRPNSRARYVCNRGYEHRWFESYTCLTTGVWLSYLISCEPKDCGVPPDIVHANKVYTSTLYGSFVRYTCSLGTRLVGMTDRKTCTANGTWSSDVVECLSDDVISCGPPPSVANAESRYNSTVMGSYVTYMCKPGYKAMSNDIRSKCQADGSWQGFSGPCSPVICGSPPVVDGAYTVGSGFTYGARVTYVCEKGFVHSGVDFKTCQDNGRWSNEVVECLSSTSMNCFDPPQFDNFNIKFSSRANGAEAYYSCLPGYNSAFVTMTCSRSSWWSQTPPTCVPLDCTDPPDITNAINSSDGGFFFQSVTVLKCSAGFTPVHPYRSYCLENGTWYQVEGNCTEVQPDTSVHCSPDPPDVANAEKRFTDSYAGSVVNYKCHAGYSSLGFEDPFHTCLETGQWSDEMIQCQETICLDIPSVPNAKFTSLSYTFDAANISVRKTVTASYVCEEGYVIITPSTAGSVLQGNTTVLVSPDSTNNILNVDCHLENGWSTPRTLCQPVNCGTPPPTVANAIQTVSNTTYLSKAEYTCELPYFLVGDNNVASCQANGLWSNVNVTCEPCDQNLTIDNGYLEIQPYSNGVGYIATYKCNVNFVLIRMSHLVCEENGVSKPTWNYTGDSQCKRKVWDTPDIPFMGRFYLEAVTSSISACCTGFYNGTDSDGRVFIGLQAGNDSTADRGIRAAFRYLEYHTGPLKISTQAAEVPQAHYFLPFALRPTVEYTICIDMDFAEQVYTLYVNREKITSLAFQPDIDHGSMKYFNIMQDFRPTEVNITYS